MPKYKVQFERSG